MQKVHCSAFQVVGFYFLILFLFTCGFVLSAHAQKTYYASGGFLIGSVVKNYPSFPEIEQPALFIQCRLGNYADGYKPWHKYYGFPDIGLNITYGSLGNKDVLGEVLSVMGDITLHQKLSEKFFLTETAALGIAHYSTYYNEETNPENVIIGSPFTIFASASLGLNYRLSNRITLGVNAAVLHGSNSHLTLPNVGINIPVAGINMQYGFEDHNSVPVQAKDDDYNKKIRINVRLALGLNEQGTSVSPVNGPKYPIYIASVFATKKVGYINKLQAGLEAYYNTGVHDYITSHKMYPDNEKQTSYALVAVGGHEFLLGHLGVLTQAGVYLYNPFYKDEYKNFYNGDVKAKLKTIFTAKLGVQYYIKNINVKDKNQLYVGCYIKTNFGQADFFETGIGYQF